ncbi:hypothetical protein [Frankia sp. AgB32]|uniref:hypothetical protein n=1 Tax=Frankia sp. AgB32 TaxID=631119 RepID=UPI00200C4F71|nr:hypothetical protein [Frankia sp. AgB32]MCK9893002.1 hypothetical protein [Frankia sp. AgB32]
MAQSSQLRRSVTVSVPPMMVPPSTARGRVWNYPSGPPVQPTGPRVTRRRGADAARVGYL